MALRWDWNEKCGEAMLRQMHEGEEDRVFTLSLYKGNAYMIMLHEYTGEDGTDMYNMYSFWLDKDHAKNCLGLNKKNGYGDNIYQTPYQRIERIRLNKSKYPNTKEFVSLLVQAFDNITIELYTDEEG